MKGDLHIHSNASDGYLSPKQIIILAKSRGVDTIAISDHNSVGGISEGSVNNFALVFG
ncbi:PHP domain-containing protein [Clostridium thailandense]|uniref:PHP domain-containing protein n=1 Tax=Clostridium thailandense TaxID=2794346 RepID=UPI003988D4F9